MSAIIYETDNMSIVASKGSYITSGSDTDSVEIPTLRIHICILVNGKIKNVFQEYEILKGENGYDFKTYHGINTLNDIFSDLGYRIEGIYGVMRKGIDKLYPHVTGSLDASKIAGGTLSE